MSNDPPRFDRSFLPEAKFEFVVLGVTHFILDPKPYAVEFHPVREWPKRAAWAWCCAAALEAEFVVHLGDLTEENAARPQHPESRRKACEQFERLGLRPHHAAGNMDIGDKPDATMWSEWVTPQSLETFHRQFERSWYSFDKHDLHCIVLNSQIMNGPLPGAAEQQAWLEADLESHIDRRLAIFMHMPPFFVEETEPDTGFYNSINEPSRSWLTDLVRQYRVECLFSGHTHFRAFNRIGETRFYVSPSTTTSRAGFYEAFSVAPTPEQGRNDPPKLGFYLARVYDESIGVYFVRTHGQTHASETKRGWQQLIPGKTRDMARSPLGVYLRTPLAHQSPGALAWPSVLRQRMRDDHPFLCLLEAGVQHVRVPVTDLDDELQSRRLQILRDEGIALTAIWLWFDRLGLAESVERFTEQVDAIELQLPGERFPDVEVLRLLAQCGERHGKPVMLTPVIARETAQGKYHPRTRFGYRAEELTELDRLLGRNSIQIDRIFFHLDPVVSPWEAITSMGERRLANVAAFDYVVRLPGTNEQDHLRCAAEALLASALQPGCRLFFDTLVDMDRTNDINHGLLDRLSNPRRVYYLIQYLNTVLFGNECDYTRSPVVVDGKSRGHGIEDRHQRHRLVLQGTGGFDQTTLRLDEADEMDVVDLVGGLRREKVESEEVKRMLDGVIAPYLVSIRRG